MKTKPGYRERTTSDVQNELESIESADIKHALRAVGISTRFTMI